MTEEEGSLYVRSLLVGTKQHVLHVNLTFVSSVLNVHTLFLKI